MRTHPLQADSPDGFDAADLHIVLGFFELGYQTFPVVTVTPKSPDGRQWLNPQRKKQFEALSQSLYDKGYDPEFHVHAVAPLLRDATGHGLRCAVVQPDGFGFVAGGQG